MSLLVCIESQTECKSKISGWGGRGRDKNCGGKINFCRENTFLPFVRTAMVIKLYARKTNTVCQEEKQYISSIYTPSNFTIVLFLFQTL